MIADLDGLVMTLPPPRCDIHRFTYREPGWSGGDVAAHLRVTSVDAAIPCRDLGTSGWCNGLLVVCGHRLEVSATFDEWRALMGAMR